MHIRCTALLATLLWGSFLNSQETTKLIDEQEVEKIRINQTSSESILKVFGNPAQITGTKQGMTFRYTARNGGLTVSLQNNTVTDYRYSSTGRSLTRPLSYAQARKAVRVKKGTDIRELLGLPSQIQITTSEKIWTYQFQDKALTITFDRLQPDKAHSVYYSETNLPSQFLPADKISQLKKSSTTYLQAESFFGPPHTRTLNGKTEHWTYTTASGQLQLVFNGEGVLEDYQYQSKK